MSEWQQYRIHFWDKNREIYAKQDYHCGNHGKFLQ